ncbi:hypothetical protein SAMN06265182_1483 [Persephonella hydrogeniphila]|uniref:Uncharacterized protein n=1 Tax=Persephonella hydrogeniphila TaxID=198703 RepID=A0A285NNC0_9AQUI|nr:hypothetical protein [Persephonella hydrogeniphila]SNZ09121.1 hypothetical protein SAMN06265182_1483 [Persephonella hydrogeniphila]
MRKYIPERKNLFIFASYPKILEIESSYLIVGNEENLFKVSFSDIENVFTIYTFPVWLKHRLMVENLNIFHLDSYGNIKEIKLSKTSQKNILLDENLTLRLLMYKAKTINNLFSTSEAEELLGFSLRKGIPLHQINKYLDFIPEAILMDILRLNYRLTEKRARDISKTVMSLTDNIVPLSFYSKLFEYSLLPDSGFLNEDFPSLSRDLTEIPRLRFKKKIIHLFQTYFFDRKDLSEEYFPKTTIKILKQLSTYFFYGNRFKRMKNIYYYMEAYKRNRLHEVFDCL